jgi:predicted RNase H-like HicB family nuclease
MRYIVMVRRTETGYCVDAPDVPGCVAAAKTIRGSLRMFTEALEMHFDLMRETGETIPPPSHKIEFSIDDSSSEELCTWVDVDMHESIPS